jgi:leucyl aminopeptidase
MEIKVIREGLKEIVADTIILGCFEDSFSFSGFLTELDQLMDGELRDLVTSQDITGKHQEITLFYPRNRIRVKRVIIVGLGKNEELTSEKIRAASSSAFLRASELNSKTVATSVLGSGVNGIEAGVAAQDMVEGALLGLYKFVPKKQSGSYPQIETILVCEPDQKRIPQVEQGVKKARAIASGVYLARDLVNLPPNIVTPHYLAETAQKIASEHNLKIFVGDRSWAQDQNMGAFLAVAKGAGEEPKFIVLEYLNGEKDSQPVILVGKGITFDSGGISIKPAEGMQAMKSDMAGAAAVLGAVKAVSLLQPRLNVVGIVPCTENMPDSDAYRPADVITASNGKTIEIISTDAEGRMILADALVYAGRYNPAVVIDLATLTGACVVALGQGIAAGLFSNDDLVMQNLVKSGNVTNEKVWPLPLWDEYKKKIESDVADMKNSGGRMGGVGSSAVFLKEFTNYAWAHLDIAGMAYSDVTGTYSPKGATGFGVRLLIEFLNHWQYKMAGDK